MRNAASVNVRRIVRRRLAKCFAKMGDRSLSKIRKDERALSVSGYVYRESVKYTDYAFDKTTVHKRKSRNHLVDQIESFRIGDKDNKREDDLLDTFSYGIAIALGNNEGF